MYVSKYVYISMYLSMYTYVISMYVCTMYTYLSRCMPYCLLTMVVCVYVHASLVPPIQFGYDFSEFITSAPLRLTKPKQEFVLTTHQSISNAGGRRMDGDECCKVPENADLTFYTTHPSTPPCLEDVACTVLGGGGGADDSLDFLNNSEEKGTESAPSCPVENLIVFTPTPKANRRKCK